jgi:tetratricopeptide (TPR) repeat protein
MPLRAGKTYLEQFAGDPVAQRALLACSAALRLDDESAALAIEVVAQAKGRTRQLLHEIKNLGCVWKQWDGAWYFAEEVRKELVDELHRQIPNGQIAELRVHLAEKADQKAAAFSPDGQITAHHLRQTLLEAGYQRSLVPAESAKGGEQLGTIWEKASPSGAEATARTVDYLAPEIEERAGRLPVQVLFLRGMAARARHDREGQEFYFSKVWEQGREGQIFAIAAHLFGNLVRDRATAEEALNDSINWNESPTHQGQVLHSLGNLLSRDHMRRRDAEQTFRDSLRLLRDAPSKGQVWHSLGNLLGGDRRRFREAEEAFRTSLNLLQDAHSKGQVWHSLGNLLGGDRRRFREAEEAIRRSIQLNPEPNSAAQAWHSLGNLLTKVESRRPEAEDAYQQSLDLWHDRSREAHVGASLANLLSKHHTRQADSRAERLALRSLQLDRGNPWTASVCNRVLAEIYERRGDLPRAIQALEALVRADSQNKKRNFVQQSESRIAELRQRLESDGHSASDEGTAQT